MREETGRRGASWSSKLGDVRYWYQREGRRIAKVVRFFLFEYVSGDSRTTTTRSRRRAGCRSRRPRDALTYRGEREMVERALSRLAADR